MQRLPLGKYVGATVFLWSVIIFLHDVAKNYGGLIALRFFLGFVESSLVPAMEVTMGMFFVPEERAALQPIFWVSCMGAPIPAGFIAYGLLWSKSSVSPWKLFMIITGGLSLLLSVVCWFFYPDNPAQAKFLNRAEKLYTIQRVHESTRGSIEQKQFKRYQAVEALRDPISWLFALQTFTLMISNNLAYQQTLLFLSLGVSNLGSTLVSAASGGFSVASCIVAYLLMTWFPNNSAYWSVFWILPAIAGGIGMVTVPWDNKLGLLACLILAGGTFGITYIAALGWTTSSASGYTKKMTRNVMFMVAYSVSNIISPQIWAARDSPRYYPAWIVQIVISWVLTPVLLLIIRVVLARRNKERQEWIAQQQAGGSLGVVEQVDDDGQVLRTTVDVAFLDLTDLENKYFIYPL
jgi:MFS family permease